MEVTILNKENCDHERNKFFNLKQESIERQRFVFFGQKIYGWHEVTRAESDTHIYWSENTCVPKWNIKTGLYMKRETHGGCSYDKSKKTFKWWFSKHATLNISGLVKDMCDHFKTEWFINAPKSLQLSTTNTNLNKVLLGKITNPRDLIKAIIKVNPIMRGMNISTEIMWEYLKEHASDRLQSLSDGLTVAKDPNHFIEYISKNHYDHLAQDLIKQAQMLGRKIDFRWSTKRMIEVHTEWTRDIMDIEQKSVVHEDYNYKGQVPTTDCLELITNSKDLYVEGRVMEHCVYTNYSMSVKDKSLFIFKYTDREVRGTLGVRKGYNDNFIIQQFLGKYNRTLDFEHHEYIKDWLAKPEVQEWFRVNYKNEVLAESSFELANMF